MPDRRAGRRLPQEPPEAVAEAGAGADRPLHLANRLGRERAGAAEVMLRKAQQVADRPVPLHVHDEAVFRQPRVVEELAQVVPPGVGA